MNDAKINDTWKALHERWQRSEDQLAKDGANALDLLQDEIRELKLELAETRQDPDERVVVLQEQLDALRRAFKTARELLYWFDFDMFNVQLNEEFEKMADAEREYERLYAAQREAISKQLGAMIIGQLNDKPTPATQAPHPQPEAAPQSPQPPRPEPED